MASSKVHINLNDEIANSISHGFGILFSIVAIPALMSLAVQTNNPAYVIAIGIYSITLLMVFVSSTLFHGLQHPKVKRVLRIIDHISIYFLIAGSYTPFIFVFLSNSLGWTLFTILWSMVAIGMVFKILYVHRFRIVSTIIYLLMGWMIVVIAKPVFSLLPLECIIWICIGGAFYTIGTIFYLWRSLPYSHLIWHLFVLGGSISHYIAVVYAVLAKI